MKTTTLFDNEDIKVLDKEFDKFFSEYKQGLLTRYNYEANAGGIDPSKIVSFSDDINEDRLNSELELLQQHLEKKKNGYIFSMGDYSKRAAEEFDKAKRIEAAQKKIKNCETFKEAVLVMLTKECIMKEKEK